MCRNLMGSMGGVDDRCIHVCPLIVAVGGEPWDGGMRVPGTARQVFAGAGNRRFSLAKSC